MTAGCYVLRNRPPPVLVPVPPRGTAARRRRRVRLAAAVAGALVVMLTVAALVAARVLARHPGAAARLGALASDGPRRAAALFGADSASDDGQPRPPARLACAPAVAVGAAGELRTVAALDAGSRATALFQWPRGRAGASSEGQAVRALAGSRGAGVVAVGRGGALAVTADGATLRALAARAPGAAVQLAVAGTRELCVID